MTFCHKVLLSVEIDTLENGLKLLEMLFTLDLPIKISVAAEIDKEAGTSSPFPGPETPPPFGGKHDPFELKGQGRQVLGPYWTDHHHHLSQYIRIQQPGKGKKYRRYQIGKDITLGQADSLLDRIRNDQTRQLEPGNAKEVLLKLGSREEAAKEPRPTFTEDWASGAQAVPRKPVYCGQCKNVIGTIPYNRFEKSIKAQMTMQHTQETGHDTYIVGRAR